MNTVGDRIKIARKAKGFSQLSLAAEVGVTRSTVNDWENNRANPQEHNAERLAQVLEIPLSALNRYGAGGFQPEGERHLSAIPQIDWDQIPIIARGDGELSLEFTTVEVGPANEVLPGEYRMVIIDDSMAPEFKRNDIIRYSEHRLPKDGSVVVAAVTGEDEGVLRNYRDRGEGYFDLWPHNPAYPTITSKPGENATIVGVVVRHVRMLD